MTMSVSESATTPETTLDASSARLRVRKLSSGTWVRLALACLILVASGGVRLWQSKRVDAALQIGRQSPFSLDQIPESLMSWKGQPTEMDEQIVRATGSTDRLTRRYVDQRTGVSLDVIVLYGPTSDMFIHSPELCYPKAGFQAFGESQERAIPIGPGSVPFRSLAYLKGEGGQTEIQEIYYAWRYNGHWSTSVSSPKDSERIPGMYKVQLARRISATESREFDNPIEAFLELLIPEIERRIGGERPTPAASKAS